MHMLSLSLSSVVDCTQQPTTVIAFLKSCLTYKLYGGLLSDIFADLAEFCRGGISMSLSLSTYILGVVLRARSHIESLEGIDNSPHFHSPVSVVGRFLP